MQFAVQNKRVFPKISPSSIRIVSVLARKAFYNVSVYGIRLDCIFCGFLNQTYVKIKHKIAYVTSHNALRKPANAVKVIIVI